MKKYVISQADEVAPRFIKMATKFDIKIQEGVRDGYPTYWFTSSRNDVHNVFCHWEDNTPYIGVEKLLDSEILNDYQFCF